MVGHGVTTVFGHVYAFLLNFKLPLVRVWDGVYRIGHRLRSPQWSGSRNRKIEQPSRQRDAIPDGLTSFLAAGSVDDEENGEQEQGRQSKGMVAGGQSMVECDAGNTALLPMFM